VLDVFSRRVVGWSIDSSQTATLVTNVPDMALENRTPGGDTIIHSDHGVQGPIHLLGFYRASEAIRPHAVDGQHRGLL
jgi:transposase InsO family protein